MDKDWRLSWDSFPICRASGRCDFAALGDSRVLIRAASEFSIRILNRKGAQQWHHNIVGLNIVYLVLDGMASIAIKPKLFSILIQQYQQCLSPRDSE